MGIEIKPSEIDAVDQIGDLDGEKVKMVRTKGGLYIALGRPRGKGKDEVLAAGSHPAIVRYNIEKSYHTFQPSMMKSEVFENSEAVEVSFFLPEKMVQKGYDIYVIKKSNEFDLILTKSQIEVAKCNSMMSGGDLVLFKSNKLLTGELADAVPAFTGAAALVAAEEGLGLIHENKKYDPELILEQKYEREVKD